MYDLYFLMAVIMIFLRKYSVFVVPGRELTEEEIRVCQKLFTLWKL